MPNKIYIAQETAHEWAVSGGNDTLDIGGLASDAVRQGDQWDRGASSMPQLFTWRLIVDGFDTAPVVGEAVHAYLAFSDGTNHDGDLGVADAASSTVVLPNCHYLGSAVVQTTTAANELMVSGTCFIESRYVTPVIHNGTADTLLSTADAHKFILTPVPPEIQ